MKNYNYDAIYPHYSREKEKLFDKAFRTFRGWLSTTIFESQNNAEFMRSLELFEKELDLDATEIVIHKFKACFPAARDGIGASGGDASHLTFPLACVREVSKRVLGLRHHDAQLLGARAMLCGSIAEMQTGEGKSLTALPVAIIAAYSGFPVHIMTVNDYLARRDAEEFKPLFDAFGLRVAVVEDGTSISDKRKTYESDIVYGTSKTFAFDFLKDRAAINNFLNKKAYRLQKLSGADVAVPVLRGLFFALVDEADSILIDEARTPLIISKEEPLGDSEDIFKTVYSVAKRVIEREHFFVNTSLKTIEWLDNGDEFLRAELERNRLLFERSSRFKELVTKALMGLIFYHRDEHYIVTDEGLCIVDEFTGRAMPDRSWEGGLHQLIEVKEGLTPSGARSTLAKSSLYEFFGAYQHVCGMSGTIKEVDSEIFASFGIKVEVIPPHLASKRCDRPPIVAANVEQKMDLIVQEVKRNNELGRPVLVGTRTIQQSYNIARALRDCGILATVLNAESESDEAEIISRAGTSGSVTIATNMAGRGTDIKLDETARELGGLHVIATEFNESKRIDRQLFGRAARQGDPGSSIMIAALDDEVCHSYMSSLSKLVLSFFGERSALLRQKMALSAQRAAERHNKAIRSRLVSSEAKFLDSLGFTGNRNG